LLALVSCAGRRRALRYVCTRELLDVLDASRNIIAAHPVGGAIVFIGLAALSAMLGFVSSAVLVPAAVYAWGAAWTRRDAVDRLDAWRTPSPTR
jgi:hypothetical protein